MVVISNVEHTAITDQLKAKSHQASDLKIKVYIDTMTEELFDGPVFWDRINKRLAVVVKTDALQNAQQFLARPVEVYRRA